MTQACRTIVGKGSNISRRAGTYLHGHLFGAQPNIGAPFWNSRHLFETFLFCPFGRAYISHSNTHSSLLQSYFACLFCLSDLLCIISLSKKGFFCISKRALLPPPAPPYEKQEGYLLPSAPLSGVPDVTFFLGECKNNLPTEAFICMECIESAFSVPFCLCHGKVAIYQQKSPNLNFLAGSLKVGWGGCGTLYTPY